MERSKILATLALAASTALFVASYRTVYDEKSPSIERYTLEAQLRYLARDRAIAAITAPAASEQTQP